ncbi:MAG: DUF3488 and transglutaminase-like domain-containing protein [Oscillospiraceae bacterium]|jgi:transglutaminase-like putative cysteine protease|nr:DUF3488 and transglutaminase-like domain-containing protein [Oscillospiraceae bacterium]
MKGILKSILFPCLLSFTVLASILYIYESPDALPLTLAAIFLFNLSLFALYEKLRLANRKLITVPVILLVGIISVFSARELINSQSFGALRVFNSWFFRMGDEIEYIPAFTAALAVLFTPFISSAVFYFTVIRYNAFFLMLTCMITFSLYAKTFTEIPFIFPALIIALFLFISIEERWYRRRGFKAVNYGKFLAAGGCFVAASAYIAGLFPPVEATPYREVFDEFITGRSIRLIDAFDFSIDGDVSSSAPDGGTDTERLLFRVRADEPGYLRRQVFDYWNGEVWTRKQPEQGEFVAFGDSPRESSPAAEWQAFFSGNRDIPDELSFWEEAPKPVRKTARIMIMTNIEFFYLPLPQYPVDIRCGDSSVIGRGIKDEFFSSGGDKRSVYYDAVYYDNYADGDFLSKLTPEAVAALSDAGMTFYMNDIFPRGYADYMAECSQPGDYPEKEKVRELALSLTDGFKSDYEKAKAIENHFYNGEFVYDLEFAPPNKEVGYFLFESKRGTCSDFASAMTVLAREAGLTARYTEGYVLRELDDDGYYLVKVKHSHAFPEIFIGGWGWVIFEPTIPGSGTARGGLGYLTALALLLSAGCAIALAVVFALFLLPRSREKKFRRKALKSPRETQITLLYNKIYGMFMKRLRLRERTLSSRDLDGFSYAEYGVLLSAITENYDRVVYGGEYAGDGDFYGIYVELSRAVKITDKKRKRKRITIFRNG